MKELKLVEKKIYLVNIEFDNSNLFSSDVFKKFVEKNPEYNDCKYDYNIKNGKHYCCIYRECCFDFVEVQ